MENHHFYWVNELVSIKHHFYFGNGYENVMMDTIVYFMENPMKKIPFWKTTMAWVARWTSRRTIFNYGLVHGKSYKDGTKLGDVNLGVSHFVSAFEEIFN